ncbi:MAG: glycosyltransferase [Bacteroidetes bacterium]|nr:glycosyltransferase [Bacteroidota bacterium]
MRILVIGARGVPGVEGGAEKNAENLFPALAADHNIRMLCLANFCQLDSYRGLRIDRVAKWKLFGTDKILYYLYSLVWTARQRPDVIHCQGLNAAFFLWFYRVVARRVVVRYGSADYVNAKWGWLGRLGFRWCEWQLRWADAVIAVTPSLRERLQKVGVGERVVVIPNAVDAVEVTPDDHALARFDLNPARFVLAVGRVTWQKDFETLITAFEAARTRSPELAKLVIVGGDDASGYLEHLQKLGSDGVVFTGRLPREELGGLYAACRLYVNSSRHEGFSNAILEAVSHGSPILVSDIVENRDLPIAAHHFFAVGDAEALADKLRDAWADAAAFTVDRKAFASWPEVVSATHRLYEILLATPKPGSSTLGAALGHISTASQPTDS